MQASSLSEAQKYRELANTWDRFGNSLRDQISGMRDRLSETQRIWADKALNNLNDSSRFTNLIENANANASTLKDVGGEFAKQMGGLVAAAQLVAELNKDGGAPNVNDVGKAALGIGLGILVGATLTVGLPAIAIGVIAGLGADIAWDVFAKDIFDKDLLNANFWDVLFDFYTGGNVSGQFAARRAAEAAARARTPPLRDPLVLDLDGDGAETTSPRSGTVVLFDHDADGIKTGTGWVRPDDGWLVLDRNGNGTIDTGRELFGVDTIKASGQNAVDGFDALREQDTNRDGRIDQADAVFANLRVWRDLNQDGISQANELSTLAASDIVSINLNATAQRVELAGGNIQTASATFTRASGAQSVAAITDSSVANLDLLNDTFYRQYPDHIPLTEQAKLLPHMQGSGRVRDLREAASSSSTLANLLQQYANQTTRSGQTALLDELVAQWAATSDLKTLWEITSDNGTINVAQRFFFPWQDDLTDAQRQDIIRKLHIVEKFVGFNFGAVGMLGGGDTVMTPTVDIVLWNEQVQNINAAYELFKSNIYESLLLQTRLASYMDLLDIEFNGDQAQFSAQRLQAAFAQAIANNGANGLADLLDFTGAAGGHQRVKDVFGWNAAEFILSEIRSAPNLPDLQIELSALTARLGSSSANGVTGTIRDDVLAGGESADSINGGQGDDIIAGRGGNDRLWGSQGNDLIDGGAGDDAIEDYDGSNKLIGGEGADQVRAGGGDDTLDGGAGDDMLSAGAGDNVLMGGDGADTLYAREGKDSLDGGAGNDLLLAGNGDDLLFGGAGDDELEAGDGEDSLSGGEGDDKLTAGAGNDVLLGGAGNDLLMAGEGSNQLDAGAGDDVIVGDLGQNVYLFGRGDGHDVIQFDQQNPGDKQDVLQFKAGITLSDLQLLRSGADLVLKLGPNDSVTIKNFCPADTGANEATLKLPLDRIQFADGQTINLSGALPDLLGTEGTDSLHGSVFGDRVFAFGGNDSISGWRGDDILHGGDGNDVLEGGHFDEWSTYQALANDGNDTLYGDDGDDSLRTYGGVDVLDGGAGNDKLSAYHSTELAATLIGGAGNDWVEVMESNRGTVNVLWGPGQGSDEMTWLGTRYPTTHSYSSPEVGGVVTLKLTGGLRPEDVYFRMQNSSDMIIYIRNNPAEYFLFRDMFQLTADGKLTAVESSLDRIEFADGTVLNATEFAARCFEGDAGNNQINGSSASDTIFGFGGNDTIRGGLGDDTLYGGDGNDSLYGEYLDRDTLYGGAGDDTLSNDGAGARVLFDGGAGQDTLRGGTVNPYAQERQSDTYMFGRGDGSDIVIDQDATLGNIDKLIFKNGVLPSDVIATRESNGDLRLRIRNTSDQILISGHYEQVWIQDPGSAQWVNRLANRIEEIRFLDDPSSVWTTAMLQQIALDGSAGDDSIFGTNEVDVVRGLAGNDTIDGLRGNDDLSGGAGNDVLTGGYGSDTYRFARGDGQDRIEEGSESRTEVDSLVFGAGVSSTDLSFRRVNDSLEISINGTQDRVTVNGHFSDGGPNTDWSIEEVRFADQPGTVLGRADIDQRASLTLPVRQGTAAADTLVAFSTGTELLGLAGNDALTGSAYDDLLDGGTGTDTMRGGVGDDTYIVDVAGDVVTENLNEGTDLVQSAVTYTLGNNVENLTLTGTAAINGTGNTLANTLNGNSATNTLNGGTGADTMAGGAGNDTYVVDAAGDVVTENLNEGTDLVQSSVTYTLGNNVENLTLTGTAAINGTGNALANTLNGNSGANRLDGGAGADTMAGGTGNDTYVVDNTGDVVTEAASGGTDTVESSVSFTLGTEVENLTLTGTAATNATGNTLANTLRGNSAANTLSGGAGNDTMLGGAGDDTYVVDATGDVITENANEGTDTVQAAVTYTLGNELEHLTLTGTTAINGTGNALNNRLVGNSANNTLTGNGGNDTLEGGAGADTLADNAGANIIVGGAGDDILNLTSTGADRIAFARGHGADTLNGAGSAREDTIELSGGISRSVMGLLKSGNDLIIDLGSSEKITLKNWYAATAVRSIGSLKIIADAGWVAGQSGTGVSVDTINFTTLMTQFDAWRAGKADNTRWAIPVGVTFAKASSLDVAPPQSSAYSSVLGEQELLPSNALARFAPGRHGAQSAHLLTPEIMGHGGSITRGWNWQPQAVAQAPEQEIGIGGLQPEWIRTALASSASTVQGVQVMIEDGAASPPAPLVSNDPALLTSAHSAELSATALGLTSDRKNWSVPIDTIKEQAARINLADPMPSGITQSITKERLHALPIDAIKAGLIQAHAEPTATLQTDGGKKRWTPPVSGIKSVTTGAAAPASAEQAALEVTAREPRRQLAIDTIKAAAWQRASASTEQVAICTISDAESNEILAAEINRVAPSTEPFSTIKAAASAQTERVEPSAHRPLLLSHWALVEGGMRLAAMQRDLVLGDEAALGVSAAAGELAAAGILGSTHPAGLRTHADARWFKPERVASL